jgi:S1-C subfamily serine protease
VGRDPAVDIAWIRVEDTGFCAVPVQFDDNDELRVGDFIASVKLAGKNFGRVPFIDAFLVSGAISRPSRCYLTTFAVSDYLGGPVVSMDGRVIGVVGWMRLRGRSGEDGSADTSQPALLASVFGASDDGREIVLVPASHIATSLANPPQETPENTTGRPPWLGVETQVLLPELAAARGVPDQRGVLVTRVLPDSPAAAAGLTLADLVIAVEGEPLSGSTERDGGMLAERVARYQAGADLDLSIVRAGEHLTVRVRLGERPLQPAEVESVECREFGLSARDLVYGDRADKYLALDFAGALVTVVRPTGFAGQGGLRVGDIVSRVDDRAVASAQELCDCLERAARHRKEELVLFVTRGRDTRFVHVQPDWDYARSR